MLRNSEEGFKFRGELEGMFDPWDRTLEMPVTAVALFSIEFVRHVQATFLKEWPLWRLHLCGTRSEGEESIFIYPDVVCVGEVQCPPANLESELGAWQDRTAKIRDGYYGCKARQWRWVLRQLPALLARPVESDARTVASFDNWQGEFDVYNIWVLQRGFYVDISTPDDCDDIGVTYAFFVDSTGTKCNPSRDGEYFSVVQYTVPKNSGRATLALLRDRDGQRWEIAIEPAAVITDEALKLEAERNHEISYEPQLMPAPRLGTGLQE